MKKVIKYKCDYCQDLFDSEEECIEHEERHKNVKKANRMLLDGCTLKEIQDECDIWSNVPEHLWNVNKKNCFTISHWECCYKPAYRILYIHMDGRLRLFGRGSWMGGYGEDLRLDSKYLKNPRPKEEMFVYEKDF